jgi:hypothetical protein
MPGEGNCQGTRYARTLTYTIEQVGEALKAQFNLWSKPNNALKRLCTII